MNGEKIYEYDLDITSVIDYGVNMEAILGGQEKIPLQGARFDVTLAGSIKGRVWARGQKHLDGRQPMLNHPASAKCSTRTFVISEVVTEPR